MAVIMLIEAKLLHRKFYSCCVKLL